jgi:hypothetical protein
MVFLENFFQVFSVLSLLSNGSNISLDSFAYTLPLIHAYHLILLNNSLYSSFFIKYYYNCLFNVRFEYIYLSVIHAFQTCNFTLTYVWRTYVPLSIDACKYNKINIIFENIRLKLKYLRLSSIFTQVIKNI